MRSIVTPQFRKLLSDLPQKIQAEAREGFERWKEDPRAVGWKRLNGMHADVYSVEIGRRWRAIGVVSKEHDAVVWMFVGSHETYNRYIDIHRHMGQDAWLHSSIRERLENRRQELGAAGSTPSAGHPRKPRSA